VRTLATLGKVSNAAIASGQKWKSPMFWWRPGNAERMSTGAPGRSTRRSSQAAAGRSGKWWITVDSHAPSMVTGPSGMAVACPPSMYGQVDRARMAAAGSTAIALMPCQLARIVAQVPVPAPRSSTRMPDRGAR
jgi:hypothetical protein